MRDITTGPAEIGVPSLTVHKGNVVHQVKSWVDFFAPISSGIKTFDLRKDDRGYGVGDKIQFEEFRPVLNEYTGRVCTRRIVYVLRNFDGLVPGYCILGLANDERPD